MKKLKVCSITNIVYAVVLTLSGVSGLVGCSEAPTKLFLAIKLNSPKVVEYALNAVFYLYIIFIAVLGIVKLVKALKELKETEKLAQLIEDRKPGKVIKGNNFPLVIAFLLIPIVFLAVRGSNNESLQLFSDGCLILYLVAIACSVVFRIVRKTCVKAYEHELVQKQKEDK